MSERRKELTAAGVVAAIAILGALLSATGRLAAPAAGGQPEPAYVARAVFCPSSSGGSDSVQSVAVATEDAAPAPVKIDSVENLDARLRAGTQLVTRTDDPAPSTVTGYGSGVVAGSATAAKAPVPGLGAVLCARAAANRWFFAAGSASLGSEQRILLYNPFPDEAVVRLTFFTPRGRETRTSFSEIPVPAGGSESVEINEAIQVRGTVAVVAQAVRGRVVAWRELFGKPERLPAGVQASLGASAPATNWYFPDGAIGPGVDERVFVLNPSGREAVVSVTVTTAGETIQAPRLMEVSVPRRSTIAIPLEAHLRRPRATTGAGVTVNSLNGTAVVAERIMWYETAGFEGVASEIGADSPADAWLLPPAAPAPAADAVAIMNVGSEAVTLDLSFLAGSGRPRAPRELQGYELDPGTRVKLPVGEFTAARPRFVLVEATGPVVAERFSSGAGDVASVMGVPLRR